MQATNIGLEIVPVSAIPIRNEAGIMQIPAEEFDDQLARFTENYVPDEESEALFFE